MSVKVVKVLSWGTRMVDTETGKTWIVRTPKEEPWPVHFKSVFGLTRPDTPDRWHSQEESE